MERALHDCRYVTPRELDFDYYLSCYRFFFSVTSSSKQQLKLLKEVTQRWLEANAAKGAERAAALTYREIWELMKAETEEAGFNSSLLQAGK